MFELRTYTAEPGKLEALLARFREHTVGLFTRHGMTSFGYWTPVENTQNQLVYLLAFPRRDAAEGSWAAFRADPAWQQVRRESEAEGPLVTRIESVFLEPTDYSPTAPPPGKTDRTFELRVYTAAPGRMEALHTRFREHTLGLFARHGMTSIGYWMPVDNLEGPLVYLLAHNSPDAAAASWAAFRQDPDWLAVRKASEEKAGGPLTVPGGMKSVYLKPTDFSPLR